MTKKLKPYLILSALVLLVFGMGYTTADLSTNSVEPAQPGVEVSTVITDEGDTTESDDYDDYDDFGDFEEVDPPVELVPGYLPEGYEDVEAFTFNGEEFEEDAIWYVPGKGEATLIEIFGPGEEDFLEITASTSPYDSLEPWIDEINNLEFEGEDMVGDEAEGTEAEELEDEDFDFEYSFEDDTVTINGVTVLLEDWTDEYGPYSVATFVHDGQFITIEGTISADEMTKVIESLPVLP